MEKIKPFQVVIRGSLADTERLYVFPTFQNLLRNGAVMVIVEVFTNRNMNEVYIKDQNGEIHVGIEITKN